MQSCQSTSLAATYCVCDHDPSARGTFSQKEKSSHPALQAGLQSRQGWEMIVPDPASQGGLGTPREETTLKAKR